MAKFGSLQRMRGEMPGNNAARCLDGDTAIWIGTECDITAQLSSDTRNAIRRLDILENNGLDGESASS